MFIDKYDDNCRYYSPQSVMGYTFRGSHPQQDSLPPLSQSDPGRVKSYVFRGGDYNVASPDSIDQFTSTQKSDFRGGLRPTTTQVSLPKAYSHVLPRWETYTSKSAITCYEVCCVSLSRFIIF